MTEDQRMRSRKNHTVEPVQYSSVSRNQVSKILDTENAFQTGHGQIAKLRNNGIKYCVYKQRGAFNIEPLLPLQKQGAKECR